MNIKKLKEAEEKFMQIYPEGFNDPAMLEIGKKHKMDKMTEFTQSAFAKEKFENPSEIAGNMVQIVSRSSMVSLFEKPKFKDFVKSLNAKQIDELAFALKDLLHGEEELGFQKLVEILKKEQLAKWSIITIFGAYFRPQEEVFVKPTTAKNVIDFFEVKNLEYKPTPTYEFYKEYRALINKMKKEVDKSLSPNNPAFSGFLMMSY